MSIPPLLCSTPPPDDFGVAEEEGEEDEENSEGDIESDEKIQRSTVVLNTNNEIGDIDSTIGSDDVRTPIGTNNAHFPATVFVDVPPDLEFDGSLHIANFLPATPTPPPIKVPTQLDKQDNASMEEENTQKNDDDESTSAWPVSSPPSPPSLKLEVNELSNDTPPTDNSVNDDDDDDGGLFSDFKSVEQSPEHIAANLSSESSPEPMVVVTLEDLDDDSSDDECRLSPRRRRAQHAFNVDENSADFFSIHTVKSESKGDCVIEQLEDDVKKKESSSEEHNNTITEKVAMIELKTTSIDSVDEFDEFEEFTSFAVAQPPPPASLATNSVISPSTNFETDYDNFASFDADFSAFESASDRNLTVQNNIDWQDKTATAIETIKIENAFPLSTVESQNEAAEGIDEKVEPQGEEEDDDFGDFEEAAFTPTVVTEKPTVAIPLTSNIENSALENLAERVKKTLELVFPPCEPKTTSKDAVQPLQLNNFTDQLLTSSLDAVRALDCQWSTSKTRNVLIASLGIDTRNVLFGEKWNPNIPRFAANLSFDPLKPQPAGDISTITVLRSSSDDVPSSIISASAATTLEVPAAEFDWNSAGLVNPLDGPSARSRPCDDGNDDNTPSGSSTNVCNTHSAQQIATEKLDANVAATNAYDSPIASDNGRIINTTSIESANSTTNSNNNNIARITNDTTSTSSGITVATTATTLPSTLPSDSCGNSVQQLGSYHHVDLEASLNDISGIVENNTVDTVADPQAIVEEIFGIPGRISSNNNNNNNNNNATVIETIDEVVTTSTFSGPLKETHIYTPSAAMLASATSIATSGGRSGAATTITTITTQIDDFDYEAAAAAAGSKIDEMVVKKEYRDVVYKPPSSLVATPAKDTIVAVAITQSMSSVSDIQLLDGAENVSRLHKVEHFDEDIVEPVVDVFEEEFTDFQSVAPPPPPPPSSVVPISVHTAAKEMIPNITSITRVGGGGGSTRQSPAPIGNDEMILSPAVLLPQSIAIGSSSSNSALRPQIEWGETATSIDPDELARIEALFPQPKTMRVPHATAVLSSAVSVVGSSGSISNTPKHSPNLVATTVNTSSLSTSSSSSSSFSISATVAHKERQQQHQHQNQVATEEDDDWSEFVSVPARPTVPVARAPIMLHTNGGYHSPHQIAATPHSPVMGQRIGMTANNVAVAATTTTTINNSNDDEWSDFVSNASPATTGQVSAAPIQQSTMPLRTAAQLQFNSGAWHNANFYNNPLSMYQPQNQVPLTNVAAPSPRQTNVIVVQQQQQQQRQQNQINSNSFNNNNNNKNQQNNNHSYGNQHGNGNSNNNNVVQHVFLPSNCPPHLQQQQQQLQQFQQIHVLQDFSTAPPPAHGIYRYAGHSAHHTELAANSSSLASGRQVVGSAKVAPSVSLIPDLGFVAPALPTHTHTFFSSLPLPGFVGNSGMSASSAAAVKK